MAFPCHIYMACHMSYIYGILMPCIYGINLPYIGKLAVIYIWHFFGIWNAINFIYIWHFYPIYIWHKNAIYIWHKNAIWQFRMSWYCNFRFPSHMAIWQNFLKIAIYYDIWNPYRLAFYFCCHMPCHMAKSKNG